MTNLNHGECQACAFVGVLSPFGYCSILCREADENQRAESYGVGPEYRHPRYDPAAPRSVVFEDEEDPNPIGWPARSFWAEIHALGVPLDEALASEWAQGPESKQIGGSGVLAPEELPASGVREPIVHGPYRDIALTPRSERTPDQREYARLWAGMGSSRQAMPPLPYGRSDYRWRKLLGAVYASIGAIPERDEYEVQPEHKGWSRDKGPNSSSAAVISLDDGHEGSDTLADELSAEDVPETLDYEYEAFMGDVSPVVGLTRGERAAVEWVVSGNGVMGVDYLSRMGDALGISQNAAKMAWSKARRKLADHWAMEPPLLRTPGSGRQMDVPGIYPRDAYDNPSDFDRARKMGPYDER